MKGMPTRGASILVVLGLLASVWIGVQATVVPSARSARMHLRSLVHWLEDGRASRNRIRRLSELDRGARPLGRDRREL